MNKFLTALGSGLALLTGWVFALASNPATGKLGFALGFVISITVTWLILVLFAVFNKPIRKGYNDFELQAVIAICENPKRAFYIILAAGLVITTLTFASGAIVYFTVPKPPPPAPAEAVPDILITAPTPKVVLPRKQSADLKIVLSAPGGEGIQDITVLIKSVSSEMAFGQSGKTDGHGSVTFTNFPFGEFNVIALCELSNEEVRIDSTTAHHAGNGRPIFWRIKPERAKGKIFNLDWFERNKPELLVAHQPNLTRLVKALQVPRKVAILLGATDETGTSLEFNDNLGGERAMEVFQHCLKRRIAAEQLHAFTVGERMEAMPPTKKGTPKNRRVICIVIDEFYLRH